MEQPQLQGQPSVHRCKVRLQDAIFSAKICCLAQLSKSMMSCAVCTGLTDRAECGPSAAAPCSPGLPHLQGGGGQLQTGGLQPCSLL